MAILIRRSTMIPMSSATAVAPAVTINPILDDYPSAKMAFGFRKLRTAYTGYAARIHGDSADVDVGFVGNDFDLATAASAGTNPLVLAWWDQSGNDTNLYFHANNPSRPTYSPTGINGKPSVFFAGTSQDLITTTTAGPFNQKNLSTSDICNGNEVTWMTTVLLDSFAADADDLRVFQIKDGGSWQLFNIYPGFSDGNMYFDFGANDATGRVTGACPGSFEGIGHVVEGWRETGGTQGIICDGTSVVSASRSATLSISGVPGAMMLDAFSNWGRGNVSEFIIWPNDLGTTSRAGARTNMRAAAGL